MKNSDLEYWVLQIIEAVESGDPKEDSRVELKASWPFNPRKVARQLAGHANAAHGEDILWIIGLCETRGVVGAKNEEMAVWYPQLRSEFDNIAPSVYNLNIPVAGKSVVALLFSTDRAPYLVRNPKFGYKGGGPIKWEAPWREGCSTRSASRSDLIKLLTPVSKLPHIELLHATMVEAMEFADDLEYDGYYLSIELYIDPAPGEQLVIPFHRCTTSFVVEEKNANIYLPIKSIHPPQTIDENQVTHADSLTIASTSHEVVVRGPGLIELNSFRMFPRSEAMRDTIAADSSLVVVGALSPSGAEMSVPLEFRLTPRELSHHACPPKIAHPLRIWTYRKR